MVPFQEMIVEELKMIAETKGKRVMIIKIMHHLKW